MSDDRWNSEDERAPYVDRGPRLPPVRKAKGPLVTADEIFDWLRGTFQPRMGVRDRDAKPAKSAPATPTGPDLTQARALARECAFSVEDCERVLIVAKRDEQLARQLLRAAAETNSPSHGDAIAVFNLDGPAPPVGLPTNPVNAACVIKVSNEPLWPPPYPELWLGPKVRVE